VQKGLGEKKRGGYYVKQVRAAVKGRVEKSTCGEGKERSGKEGASWRTGSIKRTKN